MFVLLAALAWADLPPPPGYVESCTVDKHVKEGVECSSCDASFGGRESCEALEKEGWVFVCRTSGASVWDEVLCREAVKDAADHEPAPQGEPAPVVQPEPAPPPAPPVKKERRCAVVSPAGSAWMLVPSLVLLRRRRP